MDKQKIILAGKIASQVRKWIKPQIKKGILLLEIADKIENKIIELRGKPAFPVNLSIDNVAAHYTPPYDDKIPAHGLLKIDFGVHIEGWIVDTAFSVDLEDNEENKKLITASEESLNNASELIKSQIEKSGGITLNEIGKEISGTIESLGFYPIVNLSGHSMERYNLHSGITIPNIGNSDNSKIKDGLYAVEPFATTGTGKVHDGKLSEIYCLISEKIPRNSDAREILKFIISEYSTLPFCSRWIIKKFGIKSLFGLKQLEDNGNLHHFSQLVEKSGVKVSQAENSFLIDGKEVIVLVS